MRTARVIAVVLAAGAASWTGPGASAGTTAKVTREDFRVTVEATGRLETAVAYEIGPPSVQDFWEYNLTWMIPEGSRVKKGDVIARFGDQHRRLQRPHHRGSGAPTG